MILYFAILVLLVPIGLIIAVYLSNRRYYAVCNDCGSTDHGSIAGMCSAIGYCKQCGSYSYELVKVDIYEKRNINE